MFDDTAVSASLSAVHLALAMLRRHRASARGILSPFVVPSFLFPALPWVWTQPGALAAGLIGHMIWMSLCEVLAPPVARPVSPPSAPVRANAASAATSPALPARSTNAAPRRTPGVRQGFQPTTVLSVLDEARDIKTIRLARPEGFDFQPGQFVPVRIQIDGKPHVRCYSISSAPDTRGYLEISVRSQGLVSGTLHATMRPGVTLAINRPAGHFVYPGGDDRPIALIAGGIGITPLLSMLRHAVASEPTRPVTLLYSARRLADLAFVDELRLLAARHPQVRIAATVTQPDAAPALDDTLRWRHGRIDAALVRQYVRAPEHTVFCLCGPGSMLSDLTTVLTSLGAPPSQVRFEQFETAVAASLVNTTATNRAPEPSEGTSAVPGGFRITFAASGRSGVASGSTTLLDVAESEGVTIPSSCRSGVCQACRTRLSDGEADCRSNVLDPDDRHAGFVLPCVTWPTSDCVVEA